MINSVKFSTLYPNLAVFNDPSSPTYTRRTKTGKTVLVKKGKRRKGHSKAVSAIGAYGTGNLAAAGTAYGGLSVAKVLPEKLKTPVMLGTLAATIPAGIYGAMKGYKYFRGDRYGKE